MQIKLDLHIDTVNALLTGLGKLPYEFAAPHINAVQQQAVPQVEAAQKAAAAQSESAQLPLFPEQTAD
jgi:hypothetical protein